MTANMHDAAEERNTLVASVGEAGTPVAYKGVPVMTTERLAKEFGTEAKNVQMNFSNNAGRFVEGKHFFKVEGDDLRALKTDPTWLGQFSGGLNFRSLLLWTAKGAARHAKILDTDEAWSVYEHLEDTYFATKEGRLIETPRAAVLIAPVFEDWMRVAELVGLVDNERIAANRATTKMTGVNALETLGAAKLEASRKAARYTVTELAQLMGLSSAQAANKMLQCYGFQIAEPKGFNVRWRPTEKGLPHAYLATIDPAHGKGKSRQQWEWYASVVKAMQADIDTAAVLA